MPKFLKKNGEYLGTRYLTVREFITKPEQDETNLNKEAKENNQTTILRVLSIPYESTPADLAAFFADCGEIISQDWTSKQVKKGMAHVTVDSADVAKFLKKNGEKLGARSLKIREWLPSLQKEETWLYVGNLSFNIEEEAIRKFFSPVGELKEIQWGMNKDTKKFKGYVHVEFSDGNAAKRAISTLNGVECMGR